MLDNLEKIESEYKELEKQLASQQVFSDKGKYQQLAKRFGFLEKLVALIQGYKKLISQKKELEHIIREEQDSEDFIELAKEDLEKIGLRIREIEEEIEEKIYVEQDQDKDRQFIVELRPAAGGQESSLFAADLFRMYSKYASKNGWMLETLESQPTEVGGFKEITFAVKGKMAYAHFKFEKGVHRVQRVPATESGGRIHTSTVTVAILKEPTPLEVQIDPHQIKIDTFRSSGAGGQHVNTTDSAVRITHTKSGIGVVCQDERSQIKNKAKAMRILKARLLEYEQAKQTRGMDSERKKQVGTGERSEKIRTYNFPQRRVTDHRGPVTIYRLEEVLEGSLDLIIKPLISRFRKMQI